MKPLSPLAKLREGWESGGTLTAIFEKDGQHYSVVEFKGGYSLIRYFTVGDDWVASVDYSNLDGDNAIRMVANVVANK